MMDLKWYLKQAQYHTVYALKPDCIIVVVKFFNRIYSVSIIITYHALKLYVKMTAAMHGKEHSLCLFNPSTT